MKKLWLAERIIAYEGNDVLGVFGTKGKAMAECQLYDDSFGYDEINRELDFRQHQTSENHPVVFLANGLVYEYCVREIGLNTPLMRKVAP